MFIKYYFKMKYIKGINNIKVNIFNKKVKKVILKMNKDGKIRYNYLQFIVIYKVLISNW